VSGDDLDGFFARCDDVLDNWHGSDDAMHAKALPDGTYRVTSSSGFAPVVVFSHEQTLALLRADEFSAAFTRLMQDFARILNAAAPAIIALADAMRADDHDPTDPRALALWLRQNRNTGPPNQHRLDGTHR
jgi:hypothetical protein